MKIGYQLYNVRNLCKSPESTRRIIAELAEMGYDGVELCGNAELSAAEWNRLLQECGITAMNAHVPPEVWEMSCEREIEFAAACGIPRMTINYIQPKNRNTEYYKRLMEHMTVWAEKCHGSGIQLCYHNHDFEFESFADTGRLVLETILDACPQVELELDTFWTYFGKQEPGEWMERYRDRMHLIHVKDCEAVIQGVPQFCAVGKGIIDVDAVMHKAAQLNVAWAVVEQDNCSTDILQCARDSIRRLKAWRSTEKECEA